MKIQFLIFYILLFLPQNLVSQGNEYLEAKVASENGLHQKAVQLLNNYISRYSNDSKALFLRAQSNLELKNYKLVIMDLTQIKSTYHGDILIMQARANAGLANSKLSIEQLDRYLQSTKKLPEPIVKSYLEFQELKKTKAWESLWVNERYSKKEQLLNNAIYAIKSKRTLEAKDRLDELIRRYSRSHEALYLRGKILLDEKDFSNALKDFENAVKLKDEQLEYKCALANCYAKLRKR